MKKINRKESIDSTDRLTIFKSNKPVGNSLTIKTNIQVKSINTIIKQTSFKVKVRNTIIKQTSFKIKVSKKREKNNLI